MNCFMPSQGLEHDALGIGQGSAWVEEIFERGDGLRYVVRLRWACRREARPAAVRGHVSLYELDGEKLAADALRSGFPSRKSSAANASRGPLQKASEKIIDDIRIYFKIRVRGVLGPAWYRRIRPRRRRWHA